MDLCFGLWVFLANLGFSLEFLLVRKERPKQNVYLFVLCILSLIVVH